MDPQQTQIIRLVRFGDLCRQYRTVTGSWPTNTAMIGAVLGVTDQTVIQDVWGHTYRFYPTTSGTSLLLICYGADGKPGGDRENADFSFNVKP